MSNDNNLGADCQQNLGDAQQNLGDDAQQMGTIYKITNLVNGKIYVGQTRQKLEKRINQHKRNSKTAKFGIDAAIRKYGWENFKVEVLEICPIDKLDEREIFWIDELNSLAPNGYNLTKGGKIKSTLSKETRARMSGAKKNKPSCKGENHPNYGKHLSQETRDKISDSHKGKSHTKEARAKMSAAKKGKHYSKETRDKMSAAHKGKPRSQKTRDKISAAHKGKPGTPHTPESKAKISVASKAYWARRKALANGGDS